jgi:uncharacterized protein (TIGR02466 family)
MKFLFDVPIAHNGLFVYQLDIEDINSKIYKSIKYNITPNNVDSEISKSKKVLNDLPKLKKEIMLACDDFIHNKISMPKVKYNIFSSWWTKTKPKGFSEVHNHSNSWISGCFYPDYDKSFNITFYNDYTNIFYTPVTNFNIYNSKSWTINPTKNSVIFWYSPLRHEVMPNNTNRDRHSLAFNILPEGNFGSIDSEVNIKST